MFCWIFTQAARPLVKTKGHPATRYIIVSKAKKWKHQKARER